MPRITVRRATLVVTACGLLAAPAGATAAVRHAAPEGGGNDCSAAQPCSLRTAITSAQDGDEIVVGPGQYISGGEISAVAAIDVHGATGQPRPRITFGSSVGLGLFRGTRLADVEVVTAATDGGAAILFSGDTIERVVARHPGSGSAIQVIDGGVPAIRDTVAVNSGSGAAIKVSGSGAVGDVQARLEQVTAIATADNAFPLVVESSASRSAAVAVDRSILRNTAGGDDLRLVHGGAPSSVALTRSAYASVDASGLPVLTAVGTIRAAPLLDGAEFHQLAGSPTIDAGGAATPSTADLDGDPRWLGAATDVGADEFRSAPLTPIVSAGPLGATAVAVNAALDTDGLGGSWRVDYGPSGAFGSTTGERPLGAGRGVREATAAISGLPAAGDLYYRVVLTTPGGVATSAAGVVRTSPPTTVIVPSPPTERIVTRTVKATPSLSAVTVTRGAVAFTLDGAARVTVTIKRGRRTVRRISRSLPAGRRTIRLGRLGSGRFTVAVQADAVGRAVVKPLRIR